MQPNKTHTLAPPVLVPVLGARRIATLVVFARKHVRKLRLIHGVQQRANFFGRHRHTAQGAELQHQTEKQVSYV
jgi:hypothetical protein